MSPTCVGELMREFCNEVVIVRGFSGGGKRRTEALRRFRTDALFLPIKNEEPQHNTSVKNGGGVHIRAIVPTKRTTGKSVVRSLQVFSSDSKRPLDRPQV